MLQFGHKSLSGLRHFDLEYWLFWFTISHQCRQNDVLPQGRL